MSAYKWLKFAVSIPITAVVLAVGYAITGPAIPMMRTYSTTAESSQGVEWYSQMMTWLPLVVLMLLAFMVVVAIITRRQRVQP